MRSRLCVLLAAATLSGVVPAAAAAQPTTTTPAENEPTGTGQVVVADGHVDLGARFVDGAWRVQVRDDTVHPVVWRDLTDIVLHAVDIAGVTVPDGSEFAFLGRPGSRVWVLPQTQQPGIVWPGWNTQDPSVIEQVRREVTWRLHGVDGPGAFALFLTGEFGAPEVLFDSTAPYPQETGIELGSHVHGNWAFLAPGVYLLDIEILATTVDDETVAGRDTLRFFVGPGDPTTAFAAATGTSNGTTSERATGTPSSAAPAPRADDTTAGDGSTPWLAVGGGVLVVLAVVLVVVLLVRRARSRRGAAV